MSWIDTTIVVIVVAVGLLLMYKALKEPLDLLFGWIAKGFMSLKDAIARNSGEGYETISYG